MLLHVCFAILEIFTIIQKSKNIIILEIDIEE